VPRLAIKPTARKTARQEYQREPDGVEFLHAASAERRLDDGYREQQHACHDYQTSNGEPKR
jgi:hypothetical protein